MAIKIPQNIDKEDKLIGPLTLKQFLYILGGAGLSFIAYQYHIQGYLFFSEFILIAVVIILLALAFAFVKINGFPFVNFIASAFKFIFIPKKSLWHKDNHIATNRLKLITSTATSNNQPAKNEANKSRLEELAQILDTGGKINTELPILEHEISTLEVGAIPTPEEVEANLGVEDILSDTKI